MLCGGAEDSCRTCRSSFFSAFISFSLAFTCDMSARSAWRFSYEVRPAVGRKAVFCACHCLPAPNCQCQELYPFEGYGMGRTIFAHPQRLLRLCHFGQGNRRLGHGFAGWLLIFARERPTNANLVAAVQFFLFFAS